MLTVAIIGGGASGLLAALSAAEAGAHVTIYEKQARLGRKLAATGNGRCNLSNTALDAEHYHGGSRSFLLPAFRALDASDTLAYFRELGLLTVTEPDGRVYPLSDTAGSVVDVLRFAVAAAGVEERLGCAIAQVRRQGSGFLLTTEAGESRHYDRLIVACGGAAGAKLGGCRDGYRLLEAMGHTTTPLRPALVQLRTEGDLCRSLKGVRAEASVTVLRNGSIAAQTDGEVQFTDYGLSGPAVFEISREALAEPHTELSLDLLRGVSLEELTRLLRRRVQSRPLLRADDLFTGMIHNRIGRTLLKYVGVSAQTALPDLTDHELSRLSAAAKEFRLTVRGDMGFEQAQVTAGGVRTGEFDPETLQSRICPGLFACGEVLDVDGDCGGYNLQWAWSSGRLAGLCAAKEEAKC